ncbi:hypothetical protein Gobs01_04341 [Geodermatophilus obscurus DSM 43160]|uniref:Uncharacterized protein n=1 Tax=Geodermatophilus obscurus (strain ATCC 25078 / DSM 43160 / JCM 3152 / CCUG 61914 / KCC A-0152 / KCTC 9177 / NBRC 13315 / NRRL B-3577 / G-20) TaxID=526225 RepID=D2SC05_GEOOG|nr:hypothetical protein Gobs_1442 [Geodermatophilus obscurus DSM 43160]
MTAVEPVTGHRGLRWRRSLGSLLSVALVVAVLAWFLPQFTSLSDVWASVRGMTAVEVVVLLLAAGWNLATYQFVVVATMPGLTLRQATVSGLTTTAVSNTVVGGAALALGLTYAMNSSWGFSRSRTSVSLLVSGLWNNVVKLGTPVLALTLLAFSAPPTADRRPGRRGGAGRRRRSPRPAAAQPGHRRPDRNGRRPGRLGGAAAAAPSAGARLGAGHEQVPRPDGAAAARPLARHHAGHRRQPPLAVPRPPARAAVPRGEREPGRLGRGAGCVRLRPAADRRPVHPRRARRGRAGADHRAVRGRRRPGLGRRGGTGRGDAHSTPRRARIWSRRRCDVGRPA